MLVQNSQIISWKLPKTSANPNYYACLNNGSTDLSIIEQEVVYLLFLCEGTLTVKYFSVKSVKIADTAGMIESIETEA